LASLLGVSQVTICKSLAGNSSISRQMREKVRRLAKEHGYRPNASARAMRQQRFNAVALVQSSEPSRSILIPDMLAGIQAGLAERELHLLLAELPDQKLTNSGYVPKILSEWMCDGLLINYNAGIPSRMVELIRDYQIPSIWINSKQGSNCIYPDDVDGGRQATEYLLGLGHRRIAYADYTFDDTNPYPVHYSTHDRYRGYSEAMLAAGLVPQIIRRSAADAKSTKLQFTANWLSNLDRPTAIVAYNADAAKPIAMAAMSILGMDWTRKLAIVPFHERRVDDLGVPLSTMVLPEYQLGIQAVAMLGEAMSGIEAEIEPRAIKAKLVEGSGRDSAR
jgi:DNA-binding LacI/PurR family transcriptional regulator